MKRLLPIVVAAIALSVPLTSPVQAAPSPAAVYGLAWLIGGVWTANAAALPGGVDRIEVRYNWSFTHNFIQFATNFVGHDGSTRGSYAGNFFYDPAKSRLAMWYMDQANAITQGPVAIDGNVITMSFTGPGDIVGSTQDVNFRVQVTETTPDTYHWALFTQSGDQWKPVFALDYVHSM